NMSATPLILTLFPYTTLFRSEAYATLSKARRPVKPSVPKAIGKAGRAAQKSVCGCGRAAAKQSGANGLGLRSGVCILVDHEDLLGLSTQREGDIGGLFVAAHLQAQDVPRLAATQPRFDRATNTFAVPGFDPVAGAQAGSVRGRTGNHRANRGFGARLALERETQIGPLDLLLFQQQAGSAENVDIGKGLCVGDMVLKE